MSITRASNPALPPAADEAIYASPSGPLGEPPSPAIDSASSSSDRPFELCPKCGKPEGIGRWPWCPHEPFKQVSADFWYQDEHFDPSGHVYRSLREVDAYAKANNMEPRSSRGTRWF